VSPWLQCPKKPVCVYRTVEGVRSQRLTVLAPKEHHRVIERLTKLIENGQLIPVIEQTYPLSEMPDAMRRLVEGHARGKLVITVSSTSEIGTGGDLQA
jgi:NADPH:quinone reductase-like Zn-dependent oxidoreductase